MILSLPYDLRESMLTSGTTPSVIDRAITPGVPLLLLPDAPPGGFLRELFQVTVSAVTHNNTLSHELEVLVEGAGCTFDAAMRKLNHTLPMKWSKPRAWIYPPSSMDPLFVRDMIVTTIISTIAHTLPHIPRVLSLTSDRALVVWHARC